MIPHLFRQKAEERKISRGLKDYSNFIYNLDVVANLSPQSRTCKQIFPLKCRFNCFPQHLLPFNFLWQVLETLFLFYGPLPKCFLKSVFSSRHLFKFSFLILLLMPYFLIILEIPIVFLQIFLKTPLEIET